MNLQQLCLIEEKLKPLGLRTSDVMLLASVWDDDAEAWRTFKRILEQSIKRPRKSNPSRREEDKYSSHASIEQRFKNNQMFPQP